MRSPGAHRRRGGFTLAEVAVTIAIVALGLLWVIDGLQRAKMAAAHTNNRKIATELALLTLGQIEAGLFWDEIDDTMSGTYAEEGYEAFYWDVALGDESFLDYEPDDPTLPHDAFRYKREQEEEDDDYDEDEEAAQPYEKVKIRITFPKLTDQKAEVVFERWMPWELVYGPDEEAGGESDA